MDHRYNTKSDKIDISLRDDGIISLKFTSPGASDEEHAQMAKEISEIFEKIKTDNPGQDKFKVLVDLTNAGLPGGEARSSYIKTLSDKNIEKTAFFGAPSAIQAVVSFIVSAAGRGEEVRFSVNEEEAINWLRS